MSKHNSGEAARTAEWTLLLYIAANNDPGPSLADSARAAIEAMGHVPGVDAVNVIVQAKFDTTRVNRYRIRGAGRYRSRVGVEELRPLPGSVNMAAPETLTKFVDWGVRKFPARRLALIVWSHADAGVAADGGSKAPDWRVGQELLVNDGIYWMTNSDFRRALQRTANYRKGRMLDLLGCDACRMTMVEFAYEVRSVASYLVSSESDSPSSGWPYPAILASLRGERSAEPRRLAELVVQCFAERYREPPTTLGYAFLSAVHVGAVNPLADALDALARALIQRIAVDYRRVASVDLRIDVAYDYFADPAYVDIMELANKLSLAFYNESDIVAAIKDILEKRDAACFDHYAVGKGKQRANGLSVFFPELTRLDPTPAVLANYRSAFMFASEHHRWPELLRRCQEELAAQP